MFTSKKLVIDKVYSRADLRKLFDITAAALNNGVFRPVRYQLVWLFITEEKTADMTNYVDQLKGNSLYWQGQKKGVLTN